MRGIDITITHGGFGAAYDVNFRLFGRCRDFVNTWIPKLTGLSGRTWLDEPRFFVEFGISFDVF